MKVVDEASEQLYYYEKKTILFIDEIHRFNKTQQGCTVACGRRTALSLLLELRRKTHTLK